MKGQRSSNKLHSEAQVSGRLGMMSVVAMVIVEVVMLVAAVPVGTNVAHILWCEESLED